MNAHPLKYRRLLAVQQVVLLLVLMVVVLASLAACGVERSATAALGASGPAGGAITRWTDSTELFLEHPAMIVGTPLKFAVHLTDMTDFTPLRSGRVTLRFVPRGGGAPVVASQDVPRLPGIYGPAPSFTAAGRYDLTILVNSPQAKDSITVRDLHVYATAADVPSATDERRGGVAFLKEQQWKSPGFATAFARDGALEESVDVLAEVVPAPGRVAVVSAPISGLVDASGVAGTPDPGTRVARGQVLALLAPALGESGSTFAEARARLREAEEEAARAKRLYAVEAVPQRRVHEADTRLKAAREALAGLGGGELTTEGKLAILAPIAGIVVRRYLAAGARVEAGALLFSIVDPHLVWVEAHVPAALTPSVRGVRHGTLRPEGDSRVYTSSRVVSVGPLIDSISRTLPVTFEFGNANGTLQIGATGRVTLATGRVARGVVVPLGAVLDEDGRPIAYVQVAGESFEKRQLTIGGSNARAALVLTGIKAGERVVTGAAYQVRLASLSTSVPAEGHAH